MKDDITYRIPIMSIEEVLFKLYKYPEYLKLERFCQKNISEDEEFYIEFVLGKMWYPEVVTTDRWLAWKLVQKY